MADKVFWIGDDGDNKTVKVGPKLYGRGKEIPAAEYTAPELIAEWLEKGLISVGDKAAPVVIRDTETIKTLETEIVSLKRDLDKLPGLVREIASLKKAKTGKKAERIKELEANAAAQIERINTLEEIGLERSARIKELEAHIEKQMPDNPANADTGGAGPGGGG